MKGVIVGLLRLFDNPAQTYVATDFIAMLIQQQRDQPGQSSIPIKKGMDAEEIQHVERNKQERVRLTCRF